MYGVKHLFEYRKITKITFIICSLKDSLFYYCIYNHRTTKTNQKYPSVNL